MDLGIIGMDGRHVAYVGPYDLHDADYADTPWFHEVLRKGVYVSDVFMGYRHVPHFIIAVLRHEGGRSYIMRATIDMEAIDALLRRVYSGQHSDAFLVNEQGVLQTDSLYHGKIMGKKCEVAINLATIGFKGGCNPIPFPYKTGHGKITIQTTDLDALSAHFR